MRTFLRTVLAALVLVVPLTAVAPAGAATATPSQTRLIGDCVHPTVRPHRVIIACGDGGFSLVVRHYRYWHTDEAVGRGAMWVNDCDPNCAEGTFHRTPARLRFFAPVTTSKGQEYSLVAVRWTRHTHHGVKHGRDVYGLVYTGLGA